MKKLLFSAAVLSVVGVLKAQNNLPPVKEGEAVGINEDEPRATLDVKGDFRVQKTDECTDCEWVLVQGVDGIVKKVALSNLTLKGELGSAPSNQSVGGANLGTDISAGISDVDNYVASLINGDEKFQGKIDNDEHKISLRIPYFNGNGQAYSLAESRTSTNPESAEDGTSSPITMTIKEGTLTSSGGYIEAEITTPQIYNVKKLGPGDIETIAVFRYTVNDQTKKVVLKAIGGVPDKLYGKETNGEFEHQFIYMPVVGPDGKTWLNNNLGASYARVNDPVGGKFNPRRQADALADRYAYGSLFQWGRDADGYELMNWWSRASGRAKHQDVEWYSDRQLLKDTWNPCPANYRLPTIQDMRRLMNAVGGESSEAERYWENALRLTSTVKRDRGDYEVDREHSYPRGFIALYYWANGSQVRNKRTILASGILNSAIRDTNPSDGFPVRCIRN